MASEYVTGIRTATGDRQIDYNYLANKPNLSVYARSDHTHTLEELGISSIKTTIFTFGTTAPEDTGILWIDTTEGTGGLKYYNGTAWVHVPVAYV